MNMGILRDFKEGYEEGYRAADENMQLLALCWRGLKWLMWNWLGIFFMITWLISALVLAVSVVGFPYAKIAFRNAFIYFGNSDGVFREAKICTDAKAAPVANTIWRCTFGWILSLFHVFFGVLMFATIILFPLGISYFKMIKNTFTPFGTYLDFGDGEYEESYEGSDE